MKAYRWSARHLLPRRPGSQLQPATDSSASSHPPLGIFRNHPHDVVRDLKKSAPHLEGVDGTGILHLEVSFPQQRHERRVSRQDSDLAVVRRRDDAVRVALKYRLLWRDDR